MFKNVWLALKYENKEITFTVCAKLLKLKSGFNVYREMSTNLCDVHDLDGCQLSRLDMSPLKSKTEEKRNENKI